MFETADPPSNNAKSRELQSSNLDCTLQLESSLACQQISNHKPQVQGQQLHAT